MPFACLRLSALALICGTFSLFNTSHAQSNIVSNGSFEETSTGWSFTGGLGINSHSAGADGNISVSLVGSLWQDLQTVPGRDYVISYARDRRLGAPTVSWGGNSVGPATNFAGDVVWQYYYVYVHADSEVTRLNFNAPGTIDDVKVGWLQEPIRILDQPASRIGLEGASASFSVTANGAPPLRYQWLFDGNPISGATNRSLLVGQLRSSQAGQYSVMVSNVGGSVLSNPAQLQIAPPPTSPEIVVQPIGDICPQGYGSTLTVLGVGAAPLSYQWSTGGTNIPNATNATLRFDSIQVGDAGTYIATISNSLGSVQSLPATLSVTNAVGGGRLVFDTATNNVPIFDIDGVTRLSGSNFVAQIYAGPTPDILRPIGGLYYFPVGLYAGYITQVIRIMPDVANGKTAYVQVRAWEAASGSSYEQARWAGGRFGFSSVIATTAGAFNTRVPMKSFSLRAGEPLFTTGRLSVGDALPDGTHQMILTGEQNARYLIEKRIVPNTWTPFLTLTNITGTAVFSDPTQSQEAVQFYRARILD
jgi:hypothetical protein